MNEKYINTKRCSHIAIYYPTRSYEFAGMTFQTGNYWRVVCGVGRAVLGQTAASLTDAPERPLCKRCQKQRARKEAFEARYGSD